MALTDTAVRKAKSNKKSYTLSDTDGLSLHVAPKGYRTDIFVLPVWVFDAVSPLAPILKSTSKKPVSFAIMYAHRSPMAFNAKQLQQLTYESFAPYTVPLSQ
ncbi:Arm DNA-binding domain-containing protein [Serratia oryzae]|uniref:Arm DNA-binding domain-containing protein n=1 Tax=Serratia oryzae TaxID=2034155 RepID=UPI0012E1A234|nr:Arm DNA-binding domain-containing protein [Serratia oryzae]